MYNIEEIIAEKYLDGSLEAEKYLELIEAASEQDDTSKEDSDKENEEIKKRKKKIRLIKAAAIAAAAAAIAAPVYVKNRNERLINKYHKDCERFDKYRDEVHRAEADLDLNNNASIAKFSRELKSINKKYGIG